MFPIRLIGFLITITGGRQPNCKFKLYTVLKVSDSISIKKSTPGQMSTQMLGHMTMNAIW